MGWKETDEEEYVITEDDMKEFQNNLSKQVRAVPSAKIMTFEHCVLHRSALVFQRLVLRGNGNEQAVTTTLITFLAEVTLTSSEGSPGMRTVCSDLGWRSPSGSCCRTRLCFKALLCFSCKRRMA